MGKCYIDSINDKFVLNGSNIAFNEFTKYANGKILTLDGVEIIDSTLLSRLTVSGGKLALDGILVNGLDLGNISANILPSADTMYNLGSTTRKYLRGYFGEVNTSTINLDSGSITYDGTNSLLKLGTDTIATREWVNSSAIPTLKTINGEVITGTGDITIVGGSGSSSGQTYMDIQYGYMSATMTSISPLIFAPFVQSVNNGTLDYTPKVDDSTILIKAGVLYKFEGHIGGINDDDSNFTFDVTYGLYSDVAGANLIKFVDIGYEYLNIGTNLVRVYTSNGYIKSDVDCYLKGKLGTSVSTDSVGITVNFRHTLTKYNTTPFTTGTIELPSYSTTETLTEKRWIDGKPIYRKVFTHTIGATAPTDDITITTGLVGNELSWVSDFKLITSSGYVSSSSSTFLVSDTSEQRLFCSKDGSQISIKLADNHPDWANSIYHIILEYTKTSDTPDSPTALIQGTVSNKKYFARISNGTAMSFTRTGGGQVPLSTFVKGDAELSNGTNGFKAPQDDVYTITGQFFSSTATQANINEVIIMCYVNGVEEGRAVVNPGGGSGSNKGCNITVNTKLNKNDVVTFNIGCWSTDTTTSLSVPIGSFVSTIRN